MADRPGFVARLTSFKPKWLGSNSFDAPSPWAIRAASRGRKTSPCEPTVCQARQYLHVPRTSEQSRRLGSLALLLQCPMSLERVERLCGIPQYCAPGRSFDSSCTNHPTGDASLHHAPVCSTRFVYRNAGGATVTAADLSGSPDGIRTNLLQWLAFISQAAFVVCHPYYASALWLRRTKAYVTIT